MYQKRYQKRHQKVSKRYQRGIKSIKKVSKKVSKEVLQNIKKKILTSQAKASLFFSPPEIPLIRPGWPIKVSAHFVMPSFFA